MTEFSNKPPRFRALRSAACWLAAAAFILGGGALLIHSDSWPNERLTGAILIIVGVTLLPTLLTRLRAGMRWLRPAWVPVALATVSVPAAVMIAMPLRPTGEERARLRDEAVVKARLEMERGDVDVARRRLAKFARDRDPAVDQLLTRLAPTPTPSATKSAARAADAVPPPIPGSPSSIYAERVTTYWLPEARALPDIPPADDAAIGNLLTKIEGLAINIADGEKLTLTPQQASAWTELISLLKTKQRTLFPAMRKHYAEALGARLFRRDIDVAVVGAAYTNLRLTGGIFARNANIEDLQQANGNTFARLRFTRIDYRWSRFVDDGYHYDLKVPADEAIGMWEAGTFKPVRDQ